MRRYVVDVLVVVATALVLVFGWYAWEQWQRVNVMWVFLTPHIQQAIAAQQAQAQQATKPQPTPKATP